MSTEEVDRARWDTAHGMNESDLLPSIRRRTLTMLLPSDVSPTTVWPSWPLDDLARRLAIGADSLLVDVGCGRGEIGLWIAAHVGANYVGVEPSAVGRAATESIAERRGVRARIVDGHFDDLPLADGSADAVLVVDALQFAPDKLRAAESLAQVLRPGGKLVVVGPSIGEDPSAPFAAAGLTVLAELPTPNWHTQQQEFLAEVVVHETALRADLGDAAIELLLQRGRTISPDTWHGLVEAVKA